MPATTTTKAPVGPPICTRDPPPAEMMKPVTIGAVDAGLRRQAGGDGERHRERQGDEADGDAGDEVVAERGDVVVPQRDDGLRQPGRQPGPHG